ncbi:MAG: endolytic transglycosylase MltG, partial [Ruminococcus sp.]|nr:endolytic transglycosylase MltG [Ruminococcus sp.]
SITFFACLIFIAIVTTTVSTIALSTINDILAINKESGTTVSVVVNEGDKFDDIIDTLADNGLISQKILVKMFCKFRHYDRAFSVSQNKYIETKYQPGVYYLETNSGVEAMLESMRESASGSKETVRLTFPEGWTIAQIFQKIEKYGVCTAEKLYANLDIAGKQFDFYEKINSSSVRYLKTEGYLFPDTYDFYLNENATSVLEKLFNNFQTKWNNEFQEDAKKLGRSVDDIITIASIIQREAKDKSQMANISSVLHNRLANQSTYPNLQMNSTQDYITSLKEYKLFTDYYYSVYLDSYNTYSIEGLPPGAICNPGMDAIEAALHPAQTDYHFFCHDKNGTIYLAVTAAEHKRNTEKVFYEDN